MAFETSPVISGNIYLANADLQGVQLQDPNNYNTVNHPNIKTQTINGTVTITPTVGSIFVDRSRTLIDAVNEMNVDVFFESLSNKGIENLLTLLSDDFRHKLIKKLTKEL